ncbi:hypothetical protein ACSSS7_004505 [Eimeria intestinalis]
MTLWLRGSLWAMTGLLAVAIVKGCLGEDGGVGVRPTSLALAREDHVKLDLPLEVDGSAQAFRRAVVTPSPTSPRASVPLVLSRFGLLFVTMSAALFLVLSCVATLRQHLWGGGGPAAIAARRLAEGGNPSSSCAPNGGEGLADTVKEQLQLLTLTETDAANLTADELQLIEAAKKELVRLRRDAERKRKLAEGFKANLQEEELDLLEQLSRLGPGQPIPPQLQTYKEDIKTDKERLLLMEVESRMAQGAVAALAYSPQQAAQAALQLARRRTKGAPSITAAAAQALVAAGVVRGTPASLTLEVSASDASGLEGLTEELEKDLNTLCSSLPEATKLLGRHGGFRKLMKDVKSKLTAAKYLSQGLSLLELQEAAQRLQQAAKRLEGRAVRAKRQVNQQIADWAEQTRKLRAEMEHRSVQSIAEWQIPRWTQELRVKVTQRVQTVLAETPDSDEDFIQRERLWLECKDLLARSRKAPYHAATSDARELFEEALEEAQKTLDLLQSQIWFRWVRPLDNTTRRLAHAENGLRQSFSLARAAQSLQGTGVSSPPEGEETPKGKVPPTQNNLLFFISEVQSSVEGAREDAQNLAHLTTHCPPLAQELARLRDRIDDLEKATIPPMKWLVDVWKTEVGLAAEECEEAKAALKQLEEADETEEEAIKNAKRRVYRAKEKVEFVLSPACIADRYLRQLGAPRDVSLPLTTAIKRAGGTPLPPTSVQLRLITAEEGVEEVFSVGPSTAHGRKTDGKRSVMREGSRAGGRGLSKRKNLTEALSRAMISGPRDARLLSEDEVSTTKKGPSPEKEGESAARKPEDEVIPPGGDPEAQVGPSGGRRGPPPLPHVPSLASLGGQVATLPHSLPDAQRLSLLDSLSLSSEDWQMEVSDSLQLRRPRIPLLKVPSTSSASTVSSDDQRGVPKPRRWSSLKQAFSSALSRHPKGESSKEWGGKERDKDEHGSGTR